MGMFDDLVPQQPKRKAAPEAASSGLFDDLIPGDGYDYESVEAATAATPNLGDVATAAPVVATMPQTQIDAGMNWLLGDDYLASKPSRTEQLLTPPRAPLTSGDVQREYLKLHTDRVGGFEDTNLTNQEMLDRVRGEYARREGVAPGVERGDVSDFLARQVMRVPEIGANLIELPHTISDAIYGERGGDGGFTRELIADLRRPGHEMDAAGFGQAGTDVGEATEAFKGLTGFETDRPVFAEDPGNWQELWTLMKASPWLVSQSAIDMLFAMGAPEAYVAGLTNDAATERARNDGRDVASLGDLAMGAGGALMQVGPERYATGRLLTAAPVANTTGQALGRVAREGAIQIGTENVEELADLVSRQAGTEKGISSDDVQQTMVGATLAGAPLTGVEAGKQAYSNITGDRIANATSDELKATVTDPSAQQDVRLAAAMELMQRGERVDIPGADVETSNTAAPTASAPQERPAPVLDTTRIAEALGELTDAPAPTTDDLDAMLAKAGIAPEQLATLLGDLIEPAPSPALPGQEASPASAAAQPSPVRPDTPPTREAADPAAQTQTTGQPVQASAGQSAPAPAGADLADRPRGETVTPPSVAPAVNLGDEALDAEAYPAPEGRSPEPVRRADRDQVLSMRSEIGWSSTGGRMVRATADASAMNEDERQGLVAAPKGEVIGRTRWIGQSAPTGGESTFWRDRPTKWTEQQANAAFDAFERGDKLTRQQQKIIDYAQSVADTYAQAEAEQAAELAAYDEMTHQRALRGLREQHAVDVDTADREGALSLYDLVHRAVLAGHPIESLDQPENESDGAYAARLWALSKEPRRGTDTRATQEDPRGGDQGRAGGAPPVEGLGDFALEQQPAATEPARAEEVAPEALGDFALQAPQKSEAVEDDEARRTLASRQTGLFGASETRRAADEQRAAQSRNAPSPSVGGGLFAQRKQEQAPEAAAPSLPKETFKTPGGADATVTIAAGKTTNATGDGSGYRVTVRLKNGSVVTPLRTIGAFDTIEEAQASMDAEVARLSGNPGDGPLESVERPLHKLMGEQERAENFRRWSNNAPLVSRDDAMAYNFKTGQKVVVEAIHGTKRPDRIGKGFNKKRATSGPMPYFTSDAVLGSSYAQGKADTSLSYEDQEFANWFKVKIPGERTSRPLDNAWYVLPGDVRQRIADMLPHVTSYDENGDEMDGYRLGDADEYGLAGGDHWQYEIRQARGNVLKAAKEIWLNGGNLFNAEQDFMEILRLGGMPMDQVTYDSPFAESPALFPVYIEMQRPLVTNDVPADVESALREAAKRDRSRAAQGGADMWDKNTRTLREWVDAYFKAGDDQSFVWTSIPDKVTDLFRSMGYDGIVDMGGKKGGAEHRVYIPFDEGQVKGVFNKGTFDSSKRDLLERAETEELTEDDLTEDERAAFARQSGGREAQLRAAVDAALGPVASKVKYLPDHKSLPERLRKGVESRLRQRGGGGQTAALFDPKTGDVYLFTNANPSPGRAVFNVAHEIAGHQGLRALLGDALNPALDLALQNPTVAAVSEAIALERNIDASTDAGQRLAAEEALAELAAAVRTGNYDLIADRYGVDVPQGIRASVARAIENFLRRLKALLAKQGATFSDEDVRELLENAWQAAQGEAAVDGDAADSTAPDQTKTPEFRRWFGDSKVVDADGKPLVVYHGTDADFDTFDLAKAGSGTDTGMFGTGFYFTPDQSEANRYPRGRNAATLPVYLSLKNPLVIRGESDIPEVDSPPDAEDADKRYSDAFRERAIADGHDGVIHYADGRIAQVIAFRPEQIKSATANRGTFDPDSPSILESVAEPIPANATGRSIIDSGRLLSVIDAAKAAGLDLSVLKDAHAKNSASAFVQAIDDLLTQMKPVPRVTGTKNAVTDAEREAAGRHPILRDAVRTNQETLVQAMRELRDDPSAGPEAVQRLAKNGASGISLADEAILLVHKTELLNQRDAAAKKLADPNASEDAKEVARQQWTDLEAQITVLDQAAVNSGREWGRLGQFRQRMLREDFTFEALERKERARLERPLTPDESATIAALAARIADLQSQVDMLQARVGNAESEGAYEALVKQLARPPKSRPTLESLRKAANDARARLQAAPSVPSRNRQSGAIMSPSLFADYAIIGAYHIANGAAKFADWVGAMRADLGDRFDAFKAEHPNIFKAARRQLDKPLKADATVAEVLERIDPANLKPRDVRKLIEALVGEGLRGEQAVIKSAAKHLEIAEDEVRALFVQTAPSAEPTLSEAQEELRDLKKLVRLQAEIDRLEAGEPKPPRGTTREDSPVVAERKAELAEVRKRLKPVRDLEGRYQEMRGKQIEKRIAELQARIAAGDFATRPRVPRTLSEANQRAMFELDKAKEAFLRHQFLESLKARSKWGKALGFVGDSLNLSRAIMTSIDLSALFRQGGFVTFGHPLRAGRAFAETLPALFSENAEHRVMNEIKQRPNADLYRRHGLALTGIGAGTLNKIEEAYAARWLDKVALVEGQIIRNLARRARNLALAPTRGSGRVYAAFLNQLRADSFDAMAATMTRTGVPTEAEAKWIAGFVNTATGRGKIPGKRDNAGEIVNMLAFAPRLVASRFSLVTGAPILAAPSGRAKKAAVAEYARFLAGTAVVMSLLAYGLDDEGDEEEFSDHFTFDPRSSDFMKLRFGNTRIDPFTGLAQVSTFLAREIAGETVTAAGAVKPLRPKWTLTDLRRAFGEEVPAHKLDKDGKMPYGAKDNFDVVADFARSKMSPAAGASVNVLTGSDFLGRPITLAGQAGEMLAPMSFGDIADVMEDQGIPRGTAMAAVGLLGMSLQVRKQTNAEQFADFVAEGKAVQADVKDRLAAMPVEQWPSALAAMKKEYWPMLAGVELDYYKQDGKYGEAGEPKRDADGKPKLESTRISSDYREAAGAKGGEQAHHLITDRLARRHPLMAHARGLGYDLDRPSNLLAMPEEGGDGAISHNTDHPDYDAEVFGALNAAEKRLKRDHGSLKDAPVGEVLDAVRDVEDAMRERIQRRDVPTKDGRLSALDSRPTAAA